MPDTDITPPKPPQSENWAPIDTLVKGEWEIQLHARESSRLYGYFTLFRDLGPTRTIVQVAAEVGTSEDQMYKYSRKFRWVERAKLWDLHLESEKIQAIEAANRTMASRQAKLGMMLQDKAADAMSQLSWNADRPVTAKDVVALADVGVKIERLARGENTAESNNIIIQLPSVPGWASKSRFAKSVVTATPENDAPPTVGQNQMAIEAGDKATLND
jgi:hypothetical protein